MILRQRAQALARVPQEETDPGLQLVVFSLGAETYGVPTENVRAVYPLKRVYPVPCTPSFVVGVIDIRGQIYSVIDIHGLFGETRRVGVKLAKVIMVRVNDFEVGVLVDGVRGALSVPPHSIKPPLAAQSALTEEYIRGVTEDMVTILHLEALLQDERIVVQEDVA